ncbi:MAG: hypothetical protein LBC31_00145 [Treponema sp.]|jgi:hypothetical protein|nr:hypothetical protein [Treponema sp.]
MTAAPGEMKNEPPRGKLEPEVRRGIKPDFQINMNINTIMKSAILICAVFLSGCSWDFGAVEERYRGVFDYKPEAELPQTITAVIEGDMVTISSSNNSLGGTEGTFQLGHFHVSSAINRYNMVDGVPVCALYNGTERIGYFNSGENDIFYPGANDDRQDYFIRRGSNAVVKPIEPEQPY